MGVSALSPFWELLGTKATRETLNPKPVLEVNFAAGVRVEASISGMAAFGSRPNSI